MSNLINNNKLANQSSVLEISDRGYQSFLVKVLSCQQSIQKHKLLSFFLTNRTSDKQAKSDSLIKPFFKFSTKYSCIFSSSQVLILQRQAVFIKGLGLLKHILQLIDQDQGRVSIAFFKKVLAILYNQSSRVAYRSLSSLALKIVIFPSASCLSLSRVYITSLVKA